MAHGNPKQAVEHLTDSYVGALTGLATPPPARWWPARVQAVSGAHVLAGNLLRTPGPCRLRPDGHARL